MVTAESNGGKSGMKTAPMANGKVDSLTAGSAGNPPYFFIIKLFLELADVIETYVFGAWAGITGVALQIVRFFHLDVLLVKITPLLQQIVAFAIELTSLGHRKPYRSIWVPNSSTEKLIPYSLINDTDPNFLPPSSNDVPIYKPSSFPFYPKDPTAPKPDKNGFQEWRAHFLSLCVKAAYEEEIIVKDIIAHEWKPFSYLGMVTTEGKNPPDPHHGSFMQARIAQLMHRSNRQLSPSRAKRVAKLIPQTRAFLMKNDHSVILFFRGTEPTNLVQWATDAKLQMVTAPEVQGQVHEGFYEALFYQKEATGNTLADHAPETDECIFWQICKTVAKEIDGGKKFFITGHSLGAALASVFAHCLAKVGTDGGGNTYGVNMKALYESTEGVFTFAAPLAGDNEYRDFMLDKYEKKAFRLVHAGDWVPTVPPYELGFRQHPREYYLNTFGSLWNDPADIEYWRRIETSFGSFQVLYIYKMLAGLRFYHESIVRTAERFALFFVAPGLSDHWPSDYERKLAALVRPTAPAGENKIPVLHNSSSGSRWLRQVLNVALPLKMIVKPINTARSGRT